MTQATDLADATAAWAAFVPRQVDRLFRVGRGDRMAESDGCPPGAATLQDQGLVDLILIHTA